MDGITIRTAVPADLDAVVQVEAACFPGSGGSRQKKFEGASGCISSELFGS